MSDLETSGAAEPDAVSSSVVRGLKGLAVAPLLLVVVAVAWQGVRASGSSQGNASLMVMPAVIVTALAVAVARSLWGWRLAALLLTSWGAGVLALLYAYFYAVATTGRS